MPGVLGGGGSMRPLTTMFSPELVAAIERLVDERVAGALAALHGNGSATTPWLTIEEAAQYLRVSERTLERLLTRGKIRTSTIGRRRLLHRDELDAYMRATTGEDVTPATPPRRRVASVDVSRQGA